jgi:hypothetical protein
VTGRSSRTDKAIGKESWLKHAVCRQGYHKLKTTAGNDWTASKDICCAVGRIYVHAHRRGTDWWTPIPLEGSFLGPCVVGWYLASITSYLNLLSPTNSACVPLQNPGSEAVTGPGFGCTESLCGKSLFNVAFPGLVQGFPQRLTRSTALICGLLCQAAFGRMSGTLSDAPETEIRMQSDLAA